MSSKHYINKIRSSCIKACSHSRSHWTKKRGKWKTKKAWSSLEAAQEWISSHYSLFRNYNAYICPICGEVHIGFNREKS